MKIQNKHNQDTFEVYGVQRDHQVMASNGWSQVVTWFLVFDNERGWWWVNGDDFIPWTDGLRGPITL